MPLFLFFEFFRDVLLFLLLGISLIYIILKKDKKLLIEFFLILIFVFLITQILKTSIYSLRPISFVLNKDITGSFPSRHAAIAFALSIFLIKENLSLGIISLLISVLISLLSLLSLAHFPIDVLAGSLLGIFISFLVLYLFQRFYAKNSK